MDEDRQSGLARVHTAVAKPLRGNVVAIAVTAAVIIALAIAVASVDRAASPLARCVSLESDGNLGAAIGACSEAVTVGEGSKSAIAAAERLDVLRPRLAAIEYARHSERDKVPDVVTEAWCDRLKERLLDRYLSGELIDQAGKLYSLRHSASRLREVISEHLDNEVVSCKDDAGKPTAGYWQCKWNSTHSNYNQCRRASERRARPVGDDTAEAAPQPTSPTVTTSAPVAQGILRQWLEAQNRQDFETYRRLYAPAFVGVKRAGGKTTEYRLEKWLDDRRGMFAKGFTVTADGAEVEATPNGTIVTFTQEWRSATYADRGIKRLTLEEDGGRMLITREELLNSERVSTAREGPGVSVGPSSMKAPPIRQQLWLWTGRGFITNRRNRRSLERCRRCESATCGHRSLIPYARARAYPHIRRSMKGARSRRTNSSRTQMGVSIRCTSLSPQECRRGSRPRASAALRREERCAGSLP